MKLAIAILLFLLTIAIATAQVTPFIKANFDAKMAMEGPHEGNDNYADSSFDWELQGGIEFKTKWRISIAYHEHNEINFRKFTWLILDYRVIQLPIKLGKYQSNLNTYIGIEGSWVERTELPGWRKTQASMWHYGANAEIQWMFLPNVGTTGTLNWYRAEPELTRYGKDHRWEVMIGLVFKTNSL